VEAIDLIHIKMEIILLKSLN